MRTIWNERWAYLALIFALECVTHAEEGLLLHYAFDEGSGNALHDRSGNGHDGTIHGGASWEEGLAFRAILFDGKDAYIEGPSGLTIGKAGTLEVWCYPRVFGGGLISWHYEHPATPKPLSLYFDVYSYSRLLGTMSNWKNEPVIGTDPYVQWNSALTLVVEGSDRQQDMLNRWSHIVLTYDEQNVQLFRNGKLQASKPTFFAPATSHVPMRIGLGYPQGIPYFNGMIADVRVYNRALSHREIAAQFAEKSSDFQPNLPYILPIAPRLHALQGKLIIESDLTGVPLRSGTIEAKLLSGSIVLHTTTKSVTGKDRIVKLAFPTRGLAVREYDIVCTVRDRSGESLVSSSCRWRMPKLARPDVHALNNLVAELMNVTDIRIQPEQEMTFINPRTGCVFVSCDADLEKNETVEIVVDGAPDGAAIAMSEGTPSPAETMCFLPEGTGKLRIRCEGRPVVRRLTVRSIPELMFCGYPTGRGKVEGYGAYDFDFLRKDVLPNLNTIVSVNGTVALGQQRWSEEEKKNWNTFELWKNMGRRWFNECGIPSAASSYDWKNNPLTADQAMEWCVTSIGFTDPCFSGILADEFALGADAPTDTHPHRDPRFRTAPYTEAIPRIAADPKYSGKEMYMWCGGVDRAETQSREFVNAVFSAGGKLATEEYLAERPTEQASHDVLYHELRTKIDRASEIFPGLAENLVLVPSILSAPPESDDVDPHVDFKVWMDMQMRYMATAPELFGLAGIMWYKITYADEEAVRWMGQLYRHYAIEGQTKPLSEIYGYNYRPEIIQNADFDDGLKGWAINEAEPESIKVEKMDTLGFHQGRRQLHRGNSFLLTRRCASGPNTASQTIMNLRPGKLYSVKMLASDYQALLQGMNWTRTASPTHSRVLIDRVEMLPDKSFVSAVGNERGPQMFDYHRLVFRAENKTATLTISDWDSDGAPSGTIGQELMFNFIEVQPYFDGQ